MTDCGPSLMGNISIADAVTGHGLRKMLTETDV